MNLQSTPTFSAASKRVAESWPAPMALSPLNRAQTSLSNDWIIPVSVPHTVVQPTSQAPGPEEQVFDRLVAIKLLTAGMAMHLEREWRAGLFRQLDHLFDAEDWNFSEELPSVQSYRTFLRMIIFLSERRGDIRRPALGATADGHLIAAWSSGDSRLTIECLPEDKVRWILGKKVDGEPVSNAGEARVTFLPKALSVYEPNGWWRADHIRS